MHSTDVAAPFLAAATQRTHDDVLHAFSALGCTTPNGTYSANELVQLFGDSVRLVVAQSFYALDGLVFALAHPLMHVNSQVLEGAHGNRRATSGSGTPRANEDASGAVKWPTRMEN